MRVRLTLLVFAAAATFFAQSFDARGLPPSPAQDKQGDQALPRFRAGANLVRVDAYVSKDGVPVTDFAPQDMVSIREVPLSAETQRAVDGAGYWVGTTATRQIEYHDSTGALKTIVRWTGGPLDVTDQDKQSYVNERITAAKDDQERASLRANGVAGFEFAPTLPTHGPLLVDASGDLWMSEFVRPETFDVVRWTVIGHDGVAKARVELPGYATPLWASGDRVLLRVTDELGVQLVELWKLDPQK